jgi:hypothetical protein
MSRFPSLMAVCAVLALAVPLTADDKKADPHAAHAGPMMECAKACDDCARNCEACGSHCAKLIADGKKEHLHTLRTCQDCATHCSAAANITARHGPFADLICTACAEACKRCGEACTKHSDDEMMKKCADECHKCEKACRDMVAHAGHHAAD